MIKIDKDLKAIPASLNSKTTIARRTELIQSGKYISSRKYDNRYKEKDIKEKLEQIYNGKCAYCEQNISDAFPQVEHYRPKKKYYWLAYSWDNLLYCCTPCNNHKRDNFAVEGKNAIYSSKDLKNIHSLTTAYAKKEKPKIVHPEMENLADKLEFASNGKISSQDERMQYTIDICKIDRESARDKRKKILDDFLKKCEGRLFDSSVKEIRGLVRDFINDAENPQKEYLAFRRWVIKNLVQILSTLNQD